MNVMASFDRKEKLTDMTGLAATSIAYLEDLYGRYQTDPASVDHSWRCAFDLARELAGEGKQTGSNGAQLPTSPESSLVLEIVRQRGHLGARLDPLGQAWNGADAFDANLAAAGVSEASGAAQALAVLYRSTMTVETAHIDDPVVRSWMVEAFEANRATTSSDDLRRALHRLIEAEEFEAFLARKYPTKKRFGAEGSETLIALSDRLLGAAASHGVADVVVGGMHRGRLNLMANVFNKPLVQLFAEFKGLHPFAADPPRAGDVPYHLGVDHELDIDGHKLHVTFVPNPSHLEAIDPVVLGRVRARQDLLAASASKDVLGLVFHTDASVVAQGIVAECLQLAGVPGFTTFGTIHVIVNNQIGFTTETWEARTSRHATGPWKAIDVPIIHVNGDDPEACIRAADLALAFRQAHGRDVVIDLVCYRRNGHNELDEPRFTQPLIYAAIDAHVSAGFSFAERLTGLGIVTSGDCARHASEYRTHLQDSFEAASDWRPNRSAFPNGRWAPFKPEPGGASEPETGVKRDRLDMFLAKLSQPPEGIRLNPKVAKLLGKRQDAARRGVPWSLAEALAFASLVTEGVAVRLVGQDAVRGTFSNRHFGLVDAVSGKRVSTLAEIEIGQAPFTVLNSPLSEYAVLGFEYGYSLERPDALLIWEAQFGDFANGAQIMIDQFVTSGEEKWLQPSGLVMLVPHGLEGQGPEHSSARPERYLQLAARDNIEIANPSTPANYFHLLRRHVMRRIRKPLIILAPKTLLRLPAALSPMEDFEPSTCFEPVLAGPVPKRTDRILLCTGKIAYELERERTRRGADTTSIVRLERIYPLPETELTNLLSIWPEASVRWVQEEPENMGVWRWIQPRLEHLAEKTGHRAGRVRYHGRPESPSPAGSYHGDHERDQAVIVAAAFEDI